MPSKSSILQLPPAILDELHSRLIQSQFTGYEEHAKWLRNMGVRASRMSLHRYVMSHRAAISNKADRHEAMLLDSKLRCLEIASVLNAGGTANRVCSDAEIMLDWIRKSS